MIINGKMLLDLAPIRDMVAEKRREHGVSYGLTEAGYDIRIKQRITFAPATLHSTAMVYVDKGPPRPGRFVIASAIEEFDMPTDLVGVVHDKSTWARRGLSVFNTVIEPGWRGWLTLELVYHGHEKLIIEAGSGIAQVLFHRLSLTASYDGKYQDQPDHPVPPVND